MSNSDERSLSQRKSRRLAGLCPDIPNKRSRLRSGRRSNVSLISSSTYRLNSVHARRTQANQRTRASVRRRTAAQSSAVRTIAQSDTGRTVSSSEQISHSLHDQPSTSSASAAPVESIEDEAGPVIPEDYAAVDSDYSLPSSSSDSEESCQELETAASLWSVSMTNYRTTLQHTVGQHSSGSSSCARSVPGAVQGESFCKCPQHMDSRDLLCSCGEEEIDYLEWTWDNKNKSAASEVFFDGKDIRFHTNYSSGTAVARGNMPLVDRQYFWEIKMMTPVYGTDMMVGVGTDNVDLNSNRYNFCSILGREQESWGWSYSGKIQHAGRFRELPSARFGQGSIVGLHLDTWLGRLTIYKNRQPLGVVFTGLRGKILYPMIASTAARTGMRLVTACSYKTSLGFRCCLTLRQFVPKYLDVTCAISMPPGLINFLTNNLSWLLRAHELKSKPAEDDDKKTDKGKRKRVNTGLSEQEGKRGLNSVLVSARPRVRPMANHGYGGECVNVPVRDCICSSTVAGNSCDGSSVAISTEGSTEVFYNTVHDDSGASCSYSECSSMMPAELSIESIEQSHVGCSSDSADISSEIMITTDSNLERRDESFNALSSVYNSSNASVSVCNDVCTHALETVS